MLFKGPFLYVLKLNTKNGVGFEMLSINLLLYGYKSLYTSHQRLRTWAASRVNVNRIATILKGCRVIPAVDRKCELVLV